MVKGPSLLVHLRADYRYSFSVPRCRYKLINLRTRFLCIMATFAGTLCLVPEEGRQAGSYIQYSLAYCSVSSLAAIPVHEYRYVPAHTSLCYAYLFITYAATGMLGPASTLLSWGTRTHRGDTKYNGPRPESYTDLEGLSLPAWTSSSYSRSTATMICNFAQIHGKFCSCV